MTASQHLDLAHSKAAMTLARVSAMSAIFLRCRYRNSSSSCGLDDDSARHLVHGRDGEAAHIGDETGRDVRHVPCERRRHSGIVGDEVQSGSADAAQVLCQQRHHSSGAASNQNPAP